MNPITTLLQAIESLWPELPVLVGRDWPTFEAQLNGYLAQLESEPDRKPVVGALILDLFGQYPRAHQRLVEKTTSEVWGPATKGAIPRAIPDVLARLLHPVVARYTDIACPHRVWVKTPRFSVVVRLTVRPPAHSAAAEELAVREGLPVRVRADAPAFDVLNEPEQETAILPNTDSPPLVFDLRPRYPGHTRINFDFFQAGNRMGTASVPVEVTEYEVSAAPEPRPGGQTHKQTLRTEPDARPPDYELRITCERFQAQPALWFSLRRAGEFEREFPPVPLECDPERYTERLYEQLNLLTEQLDPTAHAVLKRRRVISPEEVDRKLKIVGQNLWEALIPSELKAVYAAERGAWRDKTLVIVSDEPHIPWELAWPCGPGWEDDEPWCITLRLTRWLRRNFLGDGHDGPPTRLPLTALACLAPADSGLKAAQEERAFLSKLVEEHGLSDLSPTPPTWSKVMDLLEAGGYDWLHAAAHGNFYPQSPDADSAIWLQDGQALTPEVIVRSVVEGHINERRPAFVFNACHGGRQGWALTRLGGWANRLISSGAGLFLAPLWAVTDTQALAFVQTFYERLLANETVAEAVRQARLAARRAGDPTWLAYSVYAHPNARVVWR